MSQDKESQGQGRVHVQAPVETQVQGLSLAGVDVYVVVGAQQVQAALWVKGRWHASVVVDIRAQSELPAAQASPWPWLDAFQTVAERLLRDPVSEKRLSLKGARVFAAVAEPWMHCETLPWDSVLEVGHFPSSVATQLMRTHAGNPSQDTVRFEETGWGCARWAVAYPAGLLRALDQFARLAGGRVVRVLPLSAVVADHLQRHKVAAKLVAFSEGGNLNLVEAVRGRVLGVMHRPLPDNPQTTASGSTQAVAGLWRSLQLRSPHWAGIDALPYLGLAKTATAAGPSGGDGIGLIYWPPLEDGVGSPLLPALRDLRQSRHPLDAMTVAAGTRVWQTAVFAAVVVALVLLAWAMNTRTKAVTQSMQAQRVSQKSGAPSAPKPLTKAQQEQVTATNAAVRQLNFPAAPILRALKPPQDIRVALLGIDLSESVGSASAPKLKLNAETRTGEDMTQYVAFLTNRKPFTQVYLVRHEMMQKMPESPWRFTLELTWQP